MNRLRGILAVTLVLSFLLGAAADAYAAKGGHGRHQGPANGSQGAANQDPQTPGPAAGEDDEQEMVTVCHKPGTPAEQTLEVAAPALAAHLGHGDLEGACEAGLLPPVQPPTGTITTTVTICHKPGTPAEKTLELPQAALWGHQRHGDQLGACPEEPPEAVLSETPALAAARSRGRAWILY